ncbi:MAG: acyl-CoA thioesterase [Candidatus Rokubacteria bacterium]|nr:acyl-CoA thioesterase [Candidatus Rokubacteria bacterium]
MVAVTHVRVRYKDTDCMKIVYYGNYLTYFEVGRVEFLRQHGHPMSDVDTKIHIPVVEATVKFLKPARLDDFLEVRCWISARRRASFTFSYEVAHAESGELVATGETRHACVDPQSQKVIEIPDWLKKVLSEDIAASA